MSTAAVVRAAAVVCRGAAVVRRAAAGAARTYGYTALFCLAIAGLLWFLSDGGDLLQLVVVSCCIGFSIATAFVTLEEPLARRMSPYLAPIPITLAGLAVGLVLAGTGLGRPWYFFQDAWDTWIIGIFFGVVGFLLMGTHSRVQRLQAALARAEAERLHQETLRLETHLRMLQAQIEPHFLFNTLSNVAGLIRTAPEQAEAMLANLTTLLRASLRGTRTQLVTLADELTLVRSYLEIQQIRMGERLVFHIDASADARAVPLPPLLLQPLVENAVVHGLEPLQAGGGIEVIARVRDHKLVVEIADTGRGPAPDDSGTVAQPCTRADGRAGTGIENVLERLRALYDCGAALEYSSRRPQGVTVMLTLPTSPDAQSAAG